MPNAVLSVVIPTFNQADLLDACLVSLTAQTLAPQLYELVVVDDGSTDHTREVLAKRAMSSSSIRPVRLQRNAGRSAARNTGIKASTAPLIVFVDSDVVVREDFLQSHLATHRRYGAGIISRGPVLSVEDPAVVPTVRPGLLAASPAYLDTANAAVARAALIKAGMFDEGFPGYGWEDFELGFRLKRLGIRRVFCRRAVAYHVQPRDGLSIDRLLRKEEERAASAVYFFRKHPSLATRLLIQATPFHGFLYWVMTAAGRLSGRNIVAPTRWFESHGYLAAARFALRGVLNRHYFHHLTTALRADARPA